MATVFTGMSELVTAPPAAMADPLVLPDEVLTVEVGTAEVPPAAADMADPLVSPAGVLQTQSEGSVMKV